MKLKTIIVITTALLAGSVTWLFIELHKYEATMSTFNDYSLISSIALAVITFVLLKVEHLNFKQ